MLITLSVLWGTAYLLIAVALQSFSPVVVVFGRAALAAAVLLPLAWHRGALQSLLRHPWWVLLTVLLQATAPLLLLTYGQQWLSTGLTGILIGAQPLFVALLAVRFDPSERPKGAAGLAGLLLGFAGLALIFGVDIGGSADPLLGGILVTSAALCYAMGSILIHRKLTFAEPLGIATSAMLVATATLFIPASLSVPSQSPSMPSVLALIALGVVFTGFTLRLFYGLIARVGPAKTTMAFYLSPGVTMILGWLLLAERITWSTMFGLGAIVAGSVLAARPPVVAV
ncbi:multidrug DMT transporter permease [Rhizocola hellebori]|uniref:Multidrug DMT transporter permease n=1 Tax=Rhizocola hellebori TaxID=1392758 RepID=A0A8J3VI24_9ACTN|nr:DMT family transporter [Rhizocola hellebori]GIH08019.1 multidrug DMT transporter permease [Rhizocola hellebori]